MAAPPFSIPPTAGPPRHVGWIRLVIYAAVILAAGLRVYRIDSQSLWLDELWTLERACGHGSDHQLLPIGTILTRPPDLTGPASSTPVWRIWFTMDRVTGPPGYEMLLRCWMDAFGQTEISLRSLSVLFSLLALVGFTLIVFTLAGIEPAMWACLMFSVAGTQMHFANDARPYTLMIFEALIAVLATLQISRDVVSARKRMTGSIALTASALGLLMTHYFSISVLFALALYAIVYTRGPNRKRVLTCLSIAVLIFIGAWGRQLWRQLPAFSTSDRAAVFLHDTAPDHLTQTLWRVISLPMSQVWDARPIPGWYAIGVLWYVLAGISLRQAKNRIWVMLYLCVVGTLVLLDLAHHTAHLAYVRYSLVAGVAVFGGAAGLVNSWPVVGRFVCSAIVLYGLMTLPSAYSLGNEDFRGLGQAIHASARSGDMIVFAGPGETYAPQILYLAANHYSRPLPGPALLLESPATPELMNQLKSRAKIWLAADPSVRSARTWLPGYHPVAGDSWPVVGSLLEMQRDQ